MSLYIKHNRPPRLYLNLPPVAKAIIRVPDNTPESELDRFVNTWARKWDHKNKEYPQRGSELTDPKHDMGLYINLGE